MAIVSTLVDLNVIYSPDESRAWNHDARKIFDKYTTDAYVGGKNAYYQTGHKVDIEHLPL
ncbi:MAG TPA: hypothetical protein VFG29_14685 [Syntrophales bacterium]|nr:hypothetical protein [Syntrophales bacterium]